MLNPFEVIDARLSSIETMLDKLLTQRSESKTEDANDLVGAKEAAKILLMARQTLYTKTSHKLIPHLKRDGILLFSRKELDKYIKEKKVNTVQEEITEAELYSTNRLKDKINRQTVVK